MYGCSLTLSLTYHPCLGTGGPSTQYNITDSTELTYPPSSQETKCDSGIDQNLPQIGILDWDLPMPTWTLDPAADLARDLPVDTPITDQNQWDFYYYARPYNFCMSCHGDPAYCECMRA